MGIELEDTAVPATVSEETPVAMEVPVPLPIAIESAEQVA